MGVIFQVRDFVLRTFQTTTPTKIQRTRARITIPVINDAVVVRCGAGTSSIGGGVMGGVVGGVGMPVMSATVNTRVVTEMMFEGLLLREL